MPGLGRGLAFCAPVAVLTLSLAGLAAADRSLQQATPTPTEASSSCLPDLRKWVDPSQLLLGETTDVTLVVSQTCPGVRQGVDIVLLADESNSMTTGRANPSLRTPTSPPLPTRATPEPGTEQPPVPPEPPTPREPTVGPPNEGTPDSRSPAGGEPPFCNPRRRDANEPTDQAPIVPTLPHATRTPLPPRPLQEPSTPEPPIQPTEPGPIEPPGPGEPPGPIISPRPTEDIDALEPPGGTDQIRAVKEWVREFLSQESVQKDLASGELRLGFVSFNERARIRQPVTQSASKILSAANRMRGGEITRIEQGLREAERQLADARKRGGAERAQVIILLSDFQFCNRDVRPGPRRSGVQIIAVGFGVRAYDRKKLYDIASRREWVLTPREMGRMMEIYDKELRKVRPVSVSELVVRDQVTDTMRVVIGSVNPPTVTISGQLLEWRFAPPSLPVTLGFRVQPEVAGVLPVSVRAQASWTDSEGLNGAADFPRVVVEVLVPTPTATNTPTLTPTATPTETPTMTPTPTPAALHLPILFRLWPPAPTATPAPTKCVPEAQLVDVALVIDTSTSMSAPTSPGGLVKLRAAIDAAQELINLLKPADQVTIIGFNSRAYLVSGLTSDRQEIARALAALPATQAVGTRIDLGLETALEELVSVRHQALHNRSVVLVTDGRHVGPPGVEAVVAAADAIRARDIKLVTVGLGTDIDEPLLRDIASAPELYFPAPNAEQLLDIYRKIAVVIPCP